MNSRRVSARESEKRATLVGATRHGSMATANSLVVGPFALALRFWIAGR